MDLIQFIFCSKFKRTLEVSSILESVQTIDLVMSKFSSDINCILFIYLFLLRGDIGSGKGSCWSETK